jgi:hypothetical protein
MTAQEAATRLFDTTFLLGRLRRGKALERLLESGTAEAAVVLAAAVEKGAPEAGRILGRLLGLRPDRNPDLWAGLWAYWRGKRYGPLATAVGGGSAAARRQLADALSAMPVDDQGNDTVFALWLRLDDEGLAKVIEKQQRRASSLEMDALFGLCRGDAQRYLALDDPDQGIFQKAYLMASEDQKRRINDTVSRSQNARLVAAYDRALGGGADQAVVMAARKEAGDHDGLFAKLDGMALPQALELLEFWAETGGRPTDPARLDAVERALAAFKQVGHIEIEAGDAAPKGTVDVLAHWEQRQMSEADARKELGSEDPFVRAGALHLGVKRGLVDAAQLRQAGGKGGWMEKLVARLHLPEAAPAGGNEHVHWLNQGAGIDGQLLSAVLPGTLPQHQHFLDELERAGKAKGTPARTREGLLRIVTTLQGHFLGSTITVDESDDAAVPEIEVEDAKVEW